MAGCDFRDRQGSIAAMGVKAAEADPLTARHSDQRIWPWRPGRCSAAASPARPASAPWSRGSELSARPDVQKVHPYEVWKTID